MTRRLILIEDPEDPDALDPFRRPKLVDPVAEARAAAPPFGEGTYEAICAECHFPFRTDDQYEVLCPRCDQAEAATEQQQGAQKHHYSYNFSRFKRGGVRE